MYLRYDAYMKIAYMKISKVPIFSFCDIDTFGTGFWSIVSLFDNDIIDTGNRTKYLKTR